MEVNLSQYDNTWYKPGRNIFVRTLWYVTNVVFFMNPLNPISGIKVILLRIFGAKVGAGVIIKPGVNIKYPWYLLIGNHVWIGERVWIDNLAQVTIGDNVCISQGAMLLTGNHNYKNPGFDLIVRGITLEHGVWIGAQAIVCPGVTCRRNSILTVYSVAVSSLDENKIYQGNPAVFIRQRIFETKD